MDGGFAGQDVEGLVVRVLILESGGEGTGDVFARDLATSAQLLGGLDGACPLILCQATGTDHGVVEAAILKTRVGAGLGPEVRTHRLRAAFGVGRAHGAEHQVAAYPALLGGLDELGRPAVVHRLLALVTAPRSCSCGEDDGVASIDGIPDPAFGLLSFKVDQYRLGAVLLDSAHLLLLADEPLDLMAIPRKYPYQAPRRLAMCPCDQNPQGEYLLRTRVLRSLYPSGGNLPRQESGARVL